MDSTKNLPHIPHGFNVDCHRILLLSNCIIRIVAKTRNHHRLWNYLDCSGWDQKEVRSNHMTSDECFYPFSEWSRHAKSEWSLRGSCGSCFSKTFETGSDTTSPKSDLPVYNLSDKIFSIFWSNLIYKNNWNFKKLLLVLYMHSPFFKDHE